ncbi:MAG: ABC transporter substrate-binding protein, partial [Dehalococcoidia bacterium]|nr:ABC transporter substrate-binding protein [Dehalococcoidia bacterium]
TVAAPRPAPAAPTAAPAPAQPPTPTPAARAPALTPAPAGAAPRRGGTLSVLKFQDATHWDAHRSPPIVGLWDFLSETLVNFDGKDGRPVPQLVESWEYPNDRTLVLHVRKGVRFVNQPPVNGREFTADDVVWNLDRIRRPGATYLWRDNLLAVSSITATDKYMVKLDLKYPFAPMLAYLRGNTSTTQPMYAKEVEEKLGEEAYKDMNNARGVGAFMVKDYNPSAQATLVRNPDYYRQGMPYIDAIRVSFLSDQVTMAAALRTGRGDMLVGGLADFLTADLKNDIERTNKVITWSSTPDAFIVGLVPNLQRKPFDDIRLRKAIFLAMDRQETLKVILGAGGHISGPLSWKLFPGWTWSEQDLLKREGYRQPKDPDIAEAQRLMKELGYGPDKLLEIQAEGTTFVPWLNITPMEVAKSQLRKIWINITIKVEDGAQYLANDPKGDFLFRSRGYTTPPEVDAQLYTRHHTGAGRNFQKLSDDALDKLLDTQRQELDVTKRRQLILQAQEKLWSLYPATWLFTREAFIPRQPWVKGPDFTAWRFWGEPAELWLDR